MRTARVERKTKESHVLVEINLDGQGIIDVATGVPFFVVDMKYGISGAQSLEVFTQTLETAWKEQG